MSQKRAPLLAGLVVLLLVGLLITYVVFDGFQGAASPPGERQRNLPALSVERDESSDTPDGRLGSGVDTSGHSSGPDETPAKLDADIRPAAPITISGRTVDSDGDPIEGIALTLLPEAGNSVSGPATVSAAEGEFRLEASLTIGESYFVACLMDDKALTASAPFQVVEGKPVEGLELVIYATARAHGVVLDVATRNPIADVQIETGARSDKRLQRLGALLGRLKPCLSNDRGEFSLEGLAPGAFSLSANKPGWTASEFNPLHRGRQDIELAEYANVELLPFLLVQAAIIEGRVLAKAGNTAISGALVELGTPLGGTYSSTTSDADGKFRFDDAPPTMEGGPGGAMNDLSGLTLRASAPGYALGQRNVRARSGETRGGQDIMLDAGCTVSGRVINAKAEPVPGAGVYFNDNDFQRGGELIAGVATPPRALSATTNEAGEFSLSGLPPGTIEINASASGYANGSAQAVAVAGIPATVQITLQPEAAIFGRVTNDRGEPVAGAVMAAYVADSPRELGFIMRSFFGETLPDRGENPMFPASTTTDSDGAYRLPGLRAAAYCVIANAPGREKHVSKAMEVRAGQELEYNVALPQGAVIFGRVYDGAGRPVPSVAVTAARFGGEDALNLKTVYSDRNGNYEITGLPAGTFKVMRNTGDMARLILPNPSNEVSVKQSERVQFDIYENKPGTARIYGRVRLDGQTYANGALLLLGGGFGGFAANNASTDSEGRYEFNNIPLGVYQIARGGNRGPSLVRIRVRADKAGDTEINIDFTTVTISGRVELEGGGIPQGRVRVFASPVPPASEDSRSPDETVNELEMQVVEESRIGEKGEFEIRGLSPGFYRVSARGDQNGMVTKPYVNARASISGLVLLLPQKAASLRGVVKGLDEAKPTTPFGLLGALTIEDEQGQPVSLGGFDNAVNLAQSKEFNVPGLPEGTLTVTLAVTGYTPVTHRNVRLVAGETTTLEFPFASAGSARFTVGGSEVTLASAYELQFDIVNSKGEAFKKRFTFLDFFDQMAGGAPEQAPNSFVMKDFPPESYRITMKLPGYKDAVANFVIIAGQTTDVAVTFEKS